MINTKNQAQLTQVELNKIQLGEVLEKDYFYIPTITFTETDEYYDEYWYSLRFNDAKPPLSLISYASKVPAGRTLWQTVRDDLEKDFNYPHDVSFVIESAKYYDTEQNKVGETLTRVIVNLNVNIKFNVTDIHPLGLNLHWHEEGKSFYNPIRSYFQNFKLSDEYLQLCQKVIKEQKAGKITIGLAASKLSEVPNPYEYPFEVSSHPMLRKIYDLAFDIAGDYRTGREDKDDWRTLVETVENFEEGKWDTTVWGLSANYGEDVDDKFVHTYSIAINRNNGLLQINTGLSTLEEAFKEIITDINPAQTDERFMQNILKVIPHAIGRYKFVNAEIKEYLLEP